MLYNVCVSVGGIQFKEYRVVDSSGLSSHHFRMDSFKIHWVLVALLTVLPTFKQSFPNLCYVICYFKKTKQHKIQQCCDLKDWPCRGRPFTLHIIVGWGDPLAEHLMCTSEPIILSWLLGSNTHSGGSVNTHSQHDSIKLKRVSIRKTQSVYRQRTQSLKLLCYVFGERAMFQ